MTEKFDLSKFVRTTLLDGKEIEEIDAVKVKEGIKEIKEITKVFVYGDGARFCIDEDNIDDYFEEINKIIGDKLK